MPNPKTAKEVVRDFFVQFPKKTFTNGSILVKAGEDPEGAMYIESGLIRVYHLSESGNEINITLFKPGSFIPLTWVMLNQANRYFYQALGDVVLHVAPRKELLDWLNTNPIVLQDLVSRLLSALEGMSRRLEHLLHGPAKVTVVHSLLLLGYRLGEATSQGLLISIPVTHHELASMAGTSRETVSRILSDLQKQGYVRKAGRRFIIPDLALLEDQLY